MKRNAEFGVFGGCLNSLDRFFDTEKPYSVIIDNIILWAAWFIGRNGMGKIRTVDAEGVARRKGIV